MKRKESNLDLNLELNQVDSSQSQSQNESKKKLKLNVYQDAKMAFRRCSTPKKLVGRSKERLSLINFFNSSIGKSNAAIYISGCPGTGKTALVNETILPYTKNINTRFIQLNCMNFSTPKLLFSHLVNHWKLIGNTDHSEILKQTFINNSKDSPF